MSHHNYENYNVTVVFLGKKHSFCKIEFYGVQVKLINLISSVFMAGIE